MKQVQKRSWFLFEIGYNIRSGSLGWQGQFLNFWNPKKVMLASCQCWRSVLVLRSGMVAPHPRPPGHIETAFAEFQHEEGGQNPLPDGPGHLKAPGRESVTYKADWDSPELPLEQAADPHVSLGRRVSTVN